jgi:hypothetical protein
VADTFRAPAVPILEAPTAGPPIRGRVHKVSIVAGGEVSVVLRFGAEEIAARGINQGTLCELRELATPENKTAEDA